MFFQVKLQTYVSTLPGALDCTMSDGGNNFSVGQRQLVCLARAILRNNNILLLDEATANVDPDTDKLIQATIRNRFDKFTVVTIAHRLQTVMDNDKLLVIDAGRVVEFGHPFELLQNDDGYLTKLVNKTGVQTAAFLLKTAKDVIFLDHKLWYIFIKEIISIHRTILIQKNAARSIGFHFVSNDLILE